MCVFHFISCQANQVKSSSDMELKGARDSFAFLKAAGLAFAVFISDRHRSIAKWIREQEPETEHFFDIWHVAKSVTMKLLKVGKESVCELRVKWQKAKKNHLHWCATSTKLGFGELILAKWKSIIRHVCNKHNHHPDPLFKQCVHGALSRQYWLKKGESNNLFLIHLISSKQYCSLSYSTLLCLCNTEEKAFLTTCTKSNVRILKNQGDVVQNVFFGIFSIPPHRSF